MRRLQRVCHVNRHLNRVVERKWTARDPLIKSFAFDVFQHEILLPVRFFKTVNRGNVRMIERCKYLRLSLKSRQPIRIARQMLWQGLDRHLPIEPDILGEIHLPHPALANLRADFVMTDFCAGGECHRLKLLISTTSRDCVPRTRATCFPSRERSKPKMLSEAKFVNCFGGEPS